VALPIEDYALIGDCETAALVGKNGAIDWLALPRFDSGACFAALLGTEEHGRWIITPAAGVRTVRRHYRENTLILETEFDADGGRVRLIDFMPLRDGTTEVVRLVEGLEGRVEMRMELVIRFDYGSIVPWVRRTGYGISAIAGPDALELVSDVEAHGENFRTVADFTVAAGERRRFVMSWHPSSVPWSGFDLDADRALFQTEAYWREWTGRTVYSGPYRDAVVRSLITLKALTYGPTGGIVAAPTTSLPELIGGERNWDYRFCWLRDATFTLYALLVSGYLEEADAWREWLTRAVAGHPGEIQALYGLAGERRQPELVLPWLMGYEGSQPVRIGNAAVTQHQLDVYGEVMAALHLGRRYGLSYNENAWRIQCALMKFLESDWINPDEGIWEVRGPRRHFTHSKVMAWVGVDRSIKDVERFGGDGPVEKWRVLREAIHRDVCARGFDPGLNSFVQSYGSKELDASLLLVPMVGFLPPSDPRVRGTVEAIGRELVHHGFVQRYATDSGVDGLAPGEGVFLMCTFWLADNLAMMGRRDEAEAIFTRLLAIRNDVGLLSEEYDPVARRLLGNFPQAFSHVSLVNTASNLSQAAGSAGDRPKGAHAQ
jgi:GH15 family glucan-1,4-alpha-glucosidase